MLFQSLLAQENKGEQISERSGGVHRYGYVSKWARELSANPEWFPTFPTRMPVWENSRSWEFLMLYAIYRLLWPHLQDLLFNFHIWNPERVCTELIHVPKVDQSGLAERLFQALNRPTRWTFDANLFTSLYPSKRTAVILYFDWHSTIIIPLSKCEAITVQVEKTYLNA